MNTKSKEKHEHWWEKKWNKQCPVCIGRIRPCKKTNPNKNITLSCGHIIHFTCYTGLCNNEISKCPICRQKI